MTEENSGGKIVNIKKKAEATPPPPESHLIPDQKKKPKSKAEIYKVWAREINLGLQSQFQFQSRFYSTKMDEGQYLPLKEVEKDIVMISNRDEVAVNIMEASTGISLKYKYLWLTWKEAVAAADYWLAVAPKLEMPPIFRWADDPGITFNRLPWSLSKEPVTKCPTWHALIARMSNPAAFVAWVGSLFDLNSSLHQYVWLYGQGNDGKGSISRFLHRVLGRTYVSKQPPTRDARFWMTDLCQARLAVFPDCNNRSFVSSGFFKALTGGDPVSIEMKYKPVFTVLLSAKYLFLSNEMPNISSEKADQRRIILCEMEARSTPDEPGFEDKLWEEGGDFLSHCIAAYHRTCPTHGVIPTEIDSLQDWVSTVEEEYEVYTEANFVIEPYDGACVNAPFIPAAAFHEKLKEITKNKHERLDYLAWLRTRHGVRKVVVSPKAEDGTFIRERRYVGIAFIKSKTGVAPTTVVPKVTTVW